MIHQGDCIEWMRSLPARSVHVTIADPPYSEHTHAKSKAAPRTLANPSGGKAERKTVRARDLGFDSLSSGLAVDFAREAARLTTRWVLVFSDDHGIGTWRATLEEAGLEVVRTCPWIKPNAAPQFTGDRPGCGWEALIVAHATGARGKPIAKRWNGGGHRGVFTYDVPREAERHPTEKPIGLMLELVDLFTDRGELVIDPFAGRATTGVACLRRDRRFLGAELDESMAARARERLDAEVAGSDIFSLRRGQVAMFPKVAP